MLESSGLKHPLLMTTMATYAKVKGFSISSEEQHSSETSFGAKVHRTTHTMRRSEELPDR